ncbi:MAG: RNA 2',3'-cyclic phosphodiesterase [Gemmatimonadetes bacterium]|nr:RNA 2',3'-cyclic phosphodiesterase [Gemmatimonadota bacterium]
MRLFIAVNLPAAACAEIAAATRPLRNAGLPVRWVDATAYHLTLKFLGEVEEDLARALARVVGEVAARHPAFPLRLRGAGAFPNLRRPSVWWLGIEASEALAGLQQDVERGTVPLGFPAEQRPFSPHLTLGRTARDYRRDALAGAESRLQAVAFDRTITVETLDLMRSHLTPRGARYERLLVAPLRP